MCVIKQVSKCKALGSISSTTKENKQTNSFQVTELLRNKLRYLSGSELPQVGTFSWLEAKFTSKIRVGTCAFVPRAEQGWTGGNLALHVPKLGYSLGPPDVLARHEADTHSD